MALELFAAGYALTLADGAAEAGALALASAVRPRSGACGPARLGGGRRRGHREGGNVTVRLLPPSPLHPLADRLAVTSSARARPAR